jgi:hypothetical protein
MDVSERLPERSEHPGGGRTSVAMVNGSLAKDK